MSSKVAKEFDIWANNGRAEDMQKGHFNVTEQAFARADMSRVTSVLDLGCGNGWGSSYAKSLGAQTLYAVDLSRKMIERTRERTQDITAGIRANFEALPLADNSVDLVFSIEALYYAPDFDASMSEIYRVMKEGGQFVAILDFYEENEGSHIWAEAFDFPMLRLSRERIESTMDKCGYTDIRWEQIIDKRPVQTEEEFKPSQWFPSYELYATYRRKGSLFIGGRK